MSDHNTRAALRKCRTCSAARDLAWHEDRHGTRAEQEAEDAALDADLARIDALSDEECKAELAAEGIDYDAARKQIDVTLKLCAERAELKKEVERLRAYMPVWSRPLLDRHLWELRMGAGVCTLLGWVRWEDKRHRAYIAVDSGGFKFVSSHLKLDDALHAVCDSLGIPYVEPAKEMFT